MELRLEGTPASPGIVVGPVHLLRWEVPDVPHRIVPDGAIPREIERFRSAVEQARDRLHYVHAHAERHAGAEEAAIFEAQLMILDDAELHSGVEQLIHQNLEAARAFDLTMREWRQLFARHANPWMRERVGDITDIQIRVLSILLGLPDHDPVAVPKGAGAILVTHDLTPSLTVQLDREAIAAIATDEGTRTSHVAILARSLGLPAVVGLRVATARLQGGEEAILDGKAGALIVRPNKADLRTYRARAKREQALDAELAAMAGAEAVTLDGTALTLRANVDLPEEAGLAASSGAEGVGLMRTEFLVLGRTTMPDEDEQYRAYKAVVDAFPGQPVVIRTFDIGGDKLPVGGFPSEPNPFLGWRAIRMCLDQPELFKPQLRALLRVAAEGDVRILLPLIVSVDEVRRARALIAESAADLVRRKVPHNADVPVGVMIETPASVISADSFVGYASFFSIGTNDLVQYSLAVDRGNANLADRFTPLHPAVLRMIKHTVEVAEQHGIDLTICGEMGSNPLTAFALIGLGARQFSVGPRAVSRVKRVVRGIHVASAREAAELALNAGSATKSERILLERLEAEFGGAIPD